MAIFWDGRGDLFGVRTRHLKGGVLGVIDCAHVRVAADDETPSRNFAAALSEIYRRLNPGEQELVIMGGALTGATCFELRLPPMNTSDLVDAIAYEMPRHVPVTAGDLTFAHRVLAGDGDTVTIRVLALRSADWDALVEDIGSAEVKTDMVTHPFMAIDPVLTERSSVYLSDVYEEFAFSRGGDGLRHCVWLDADEREVKLLEAAPEMLRSEMRVDCSLLEHRAGDLPDSFLPALILARYAGSREFQNDLPGALKLPREMVPRRFRGLRRLFIFMTALVAMVVLSFVGRLWWEARRNYGAIADEIKRLSFQIDKTKRENTARGDFQDKLELIYETNLGNNEAIHCLHRLTDAIPDGVWMTSFNIQEDNVSFDLKTKDGDGASAATDYLDKLKDILKVVDVQKNRNLRDQSTLIKVRTKYLSSKKPLDKEDGEGG